jgi:hypothetical protein
VLVFGLARAISTWARVARWGQHPYLTEPSKHNVVPHDCEPSHAVLLGHSCMLVELKLCAGVRAAGTAAAAAAAAT